MLTALSLTLSRIWRYNLAQAPKTNFLVIFLCLISNCISTFAKCILIKQFFIAKSDLSTVYPLETGCFPTFYKFQQLLHSQGTAFQLHNFIVGKSRCSYLNCASFRTVHRCFTPNIREIEICSSTILNFVNTPKVRFWTEKLRESLIFSLPLLPYFSFPPEEHAREQLLLYFARL